MTDKELEKKIQELLADQERLARELWEPIIKKTLELVKAILKPK